MSQTGWSLGSRRLSGAFPREAARAGFAGFRAGLAALAGFRAGLADFRVDFLVATKRPSQKNFGHSNRITLPSQPFPRPSRSQAWRSSRSAVAAGAPPRT